MLNSSPNIVRFSDDKFSYIKSIKVIYLLAPHKQDWCVKDMVLINSTCESSK